MKIAHKTLAVATVVFSLLLAVFIPAGCLGTDNPPAGSGNAADVAELEAQKQENIAFVSENAASLAFMVHDRINEERNNNGLAPLQWDGRLAGIALAHSQDMARRDYFDHVSPEGDDFADRYERAGYDLETPVGNQVLVGGENLFLNNVVRSYTYNPDTDEVYEYIYNNLEELADSTVQGWMESPGHRENILTPFTREGIGVFVDNDGEVYITENFS